MKHTPSACVLYSIEHTKDALPDGLPQKALTFMSAEEMKGKPLEHTAPLFLKECQMIKDQVSRVEIKTRGQSKNDLWHQQRIGRVNACFCRGSAEHLLKACLKHKDVEAAPRLLKRKRWILLHPSLPSRYLGSMLRKILLKNKQPSGPVLLWS